MITSAVYDLISAFDSCPLFPSMSASVIPAQAGIHCGQISAPPGAVYVSGMDDID